MAADKSKITENLWSIVEKETERLLDVSKAGALGPEDQEALSNMARVARTLSLHNPGEDSWQAPENAEDLRQALKLLRDDDDAES